MKKNKKLYQVRDLTDKLMILYYLNHRHLDLVLEPEKTLEDYQYLAREHIKQKTLLVEIHRGKLCQVNSCGLLMTKNNLLNLVQDPILMTNYEQ